MKITDVTITLFTWDNIPATTYGRHTGRMPSTSDMGLVTIRTDEGVEGHAFLGNSSRAASNDAQSLINFLKPLLMGQDPLDREKLYYLTMLRGRNTTLRCIGAVDLALWDIAGKVAKLPLHKLMGSYRSSAPAYASSSVHPAPKDYADEAAMFKSQGWKAYKIHPPTDPDLDIKVCEAVRKAVGDDMVLMLDSTWAYDYPSALKVGLAVQALGYLWYEDPLAEDDIEGYVRLKQQLHIPLMATEAHPGGLTTYAPWLMARCTDYLRGDPAVKGGLTSCLKTAHLAEAFHLNYEVHHGGNSLTNVANLHLIMAIKNCEYFEVLLPSGAQKYGLVEDIEVDREGMVHIAPFNTPGVGAKIDFDLIKRKQIAVLR